MPVVEADVGQCTVRDAEGRERLGPDAVNRQKVLRRAPLPVDEPPRRRLVARIVQADGGWR